jgi:shikimate kinase
MQKRTVAILIPAFKLFLIGMPGVGKSYWGAIVAQHIGLPFIDLDTLIANGEGVSITELFAKYGEASFREKERNYLNQIVTNNTEPSVVACGGGTPFFYDNMQQMKEAGRVVYLSADIDFLIGNLTKEENTRPLLTNRNTIRQQLEMLYTQRKEYYLQAHYILQAKDISVATFVEILRDV